MSNPDLLSLAVLYVGGIFAMCGAYFNWNWFFNNRRARIPVMVLGRTGACIFYFIGGFCLFAFGSLLLGALV